MNPLSLRRLQFFTIRTRNLPAARRFYVDLLGLDVVSEKPGEYVQVSIAGVPLCVDVTSDDSPQQPNQIGIEVDSLERTMEALRTRGITVATGSARSEHWASVKDPDGHEILFIARS
jgi:catechol 2,3-dioxygenase-like lactoylglutathione lyase family enzyme